MSPNIMAGADFKRDLPLFYSFFYHDHSDIYLLFYVPPSNITVPVECIIKYIWRKFAENNHTFHSCFNLSDCRKQYNHNLYVLCTDTN